MPWAALVGLLSVPVGLVAGRLLPDRLSRIRAHAELLEKLQGDERKELAELLAAEVSAYVAKQRGRLVRKVNWWVVAGLVVAVLAVGAAITAAIRIDDNEGVVLLLAAATSTSAAASALGASLYRAATRDEVPDLVAIFEESLK